MLLQKTYVLELLRYTHVHRIFLVCDMYSLFVGQNAEYWRIQLYSLSNTVQTATNYWRYSAVLKSKVPACCIYDIYKTPVIMKHREFAWAEICNYNVFGVAFLYVKNIFIADKKDKTMKYLKNNKLPEFWRFLSKQKDTIVITAQYCWICHLFQCSWDFN